VKARLNEAPGLRGDGPDVHPRLLLLAGSVLVVVWEFLPAFSQRTTVPDGMLAEVGEKALSFMVMRKSAAEGLASNCPDSANREVASARIRPASHGFGHVRLRRRGCLRGDRVMAAVPR